MIKYNKQELQEWFFNELENDEREELKNFFDRDDVIEAVNTNNIYKLYIIYGEHITLQANVLTACLLLSGIDPLEYNLPFIIDYMFYMLPIDNIYGYSSEDIFNAILSFFNIPKNSVYIKFLK